MLIATYLDGARRAHRALTEWDQAAGDGDFGDNLRSGLQAAADRISDGAGLAEQLRVAADWFLDEVGGTSGPLFGLLFDAMARRVGAGPGSGPDTNSEAAPGSCVESGDDEDRALIDGLADGTAAIIRVGDARVGDRTMVDALQPTVAHLRSGRGRVDWAEAARVALQHARQTAEIRARMGRASYLGERAIGTPDPGAMGVALLFWSLAHTRDPNGAAELTSPADWG